MPAYSHSHIVTAGYLRAWTADGVVMTCWADGSQQRPLPVEVVGVRSGFYRERLPDGSTRNRLDPVMSKLEGKALGVIRDIETRWPLSDADRAPVAEFMALQLMRGPAWREWYSAALDSAHRDVRAAQPGHTDASLLAARDALGKDHERHNTLVLNLPPLSTVFANMRWTLLRCGRPRLATSDHPFVPVWIGHRSVTPVRAVPPEGVQSVHEYRFALSPYLLLLLTWADDFGPEQLVRARIEHVRNHNASVIAQADEQWFHHPDLSPERMASPWLPLAETFHGDDYRSHRIRRQVVHDLVTELMEADLSEWGIRIVDWHSAAVPRST
jgi:hypothetical protein